jgi:hypothetical protein
MAKLYHPELDVTIERPESSVPVHMASGWLPVSDRPQVAASRSMAGSPDSGADANAAASEEPEKKSEKSAARTRRSSTTSEESTDGGA